MPDTVLDTEDTVVNKTKSLFSQSLHPSEERDSVARR